MERYYYYWRDIIITWTDIIIGEILLDIIWFCGVFPPDQLHVKMSWKDIITEWFSKKSITAPDGKLSTMNIAEILVEKNIIPPGIKNNATLHGVLLTRILLETLDAIKVPRAPWDPNGNFVYHMNAKEMLKWSMGRKNEEEVKALEKETGVNLEHYHKLNTNKQTFVCAKHGFGECKGECKGNLSKKRKLESA